MNVTWMIRILLVCPQTSGCAATPRPSRGLGEGRRAPGTTAKTARSARKSSAGRWPSTSAASRSRTDVTRPASQRTAKTSWRRTKRWRRSRTRLSRWGRNQVPLRRPRKREVVDDSVILTSKRHAIVIFISKTLDKINDI